MKRHSVYKFIWISSNVLLALVFIIFAVSAVWEYSTRQYLKGFSDAVVPHDAAPEQKVEAILAWMAHGPARQSAPDADELLTRDPHNTLNYKKLIDVCGGATNAFINLSVSSDLRVRRLLLLDANRLTTHVVAEVWIDGRWIVVDPAFRVVLKNAAGATLTREELENPEVLRQATEAIPDYLPIYNYSGTVHVRVSRIPVVGTMFRNILNRVWPHWEESLDWTLLLERDSFAALVGSFIALVLLMLTRLYLRQYGEKKLGFAHMHLRRKFWQAGVTLMGNQHI